MKKIAISTALFLMFGAFSANATDLNTNVTVSTTVKTPAKLSVVYTEGSPLPTSVTPNITVGELAISGYNGTPNYDDLNITTPTGVAGHVQLDRVSDGRGGISYVWTSFTNKNGAGIKINGKVSDKLTAATGNMTAGSEVLYLKTMFNDTLNAGKYTGDIVVHLSNQ
ncbi:hypothetical protein I5418_21440 [Citrobacter braakii]|uniref:hypothetical protein n=1 Tax=Citrobacter braakii TaxID=57706 RepID=UPI0019083A2D|nr:hypothetical protein [Citrobacter braakii]MBJ8899659.1 hypothetical protein [Citrobacter braakii]